MTDLRWETVYQWALWYPSHAMMDIQEMDVHQLLVRFLGNGHIPYQHATKVYFDISFCSYPSDFFISITKNCCRNNNYSKLNVVWQPTTQPPRHGQETEF